MGELEYVLTAADRQVLDDINLQAANTLRPLLGSSAQSTGVALLDFPNHQNVGDAMIWGGERAHLARLNVPVRYTCDAWHFDRRVLDAYAPDAPVLFHGGGNFGDLWEYYQAFREDTIGELKERKVIQLPQTIWFEDEAAAARANQIFGAHPDFTLLVRDSASVVRARALLPDVRAVFCPDLAMGIGPMGRFKSASMNVLLLRRDQEAQQDRDAHLRAEGHRDDWGLTGVRQTVWDLSLLPTGLHKVRPLRRVFHPLVAASYDRAYSLNIRSGTRQVGIARALLTDRLHAHILACLMGTPNVVLDNNYGKVRTIFDDYTHRFSTARLAGTLEEASDLWRDVTTQS